MPEAILKVLPTSEMCLVWDRGDMGQPLPYQNLMANIFELYQLFRCHTPTSKRPEFLTQGFSQAQLLPPMFEEVLMMVAIFPKDSSPYQALWGVFPDFRVQTSL